MSLLFRTSAIFLLVLLFFTAAPSSINAFYTYETKTSDLELRGTARLYGGLQKNPEDNLIYDEKYDESWGAVFSLLADANMGEHYSFSTNILQVVRSVSVASFLNSPALMVERSSSFIRNQHDTTNTKAYIELDTFFFKFQTNKVEATLGRQPINLATTLYFTPNDFFAPFNAQDFYRVFKPGVDALRSEIRFGQLTQLSLIGVLGYEEDSTSDNGWSKEPDWDRTSVIGRLATAALNFEWAVLGGSVRETYIAGGSLQGEVFNWLGIRAEGHYGAPEDEQSDDYTVLSIGVEHRFENSLDVHLEQFFNGQGYSNIESAIASGTGGNRSPYLGEDYTAFSLGYEFTPLLFGQLLYTQNWTDQSAILSGNAVYSLSDESELVATFSLPFGDEPEGLTIKSEYGTLPSAFTVEYRLYF